MNPLFTFLSVLLLIYQSPKYLENCEAMALGRQNSEILSSALPSFYNLFLRWKFHNVKEVNPSKMLNIEIILHSEYKELKLSGWRL